MELLRAILGTLVVSVLLVNASLIKEVQIGSCGCGCSNRKPESASLTTEATPTSTPPPTSVNRNIEEAVIELAGELSGMVSDAGSTNSTNVTEISITTIIEFKVKIERWTIDVKRLTFADIATVRSTTQQVRSLRDEVKSGTKIITSKSISIIQTSIKTVAIFISGIARAIEDEDREITLKNSEIIVTQVESTVESIFSSVTQLQTTLSQSTLSSSTSSISITVIIQIIQIIESIISSGLSVMTQETLTTLTTHLSDLQILISAIEGGATLNSEDTQQVSHLLTVMTTVSKSISSAVIKTNNKIEAHAESLMLKDLMSATSVVKESISKIIAAQQTVEASATVMTYTISEEIVTAFNSLQLSLEFVSEEQITIIKSFEFVGIEILTLLETNNVNIKGFELIQSANKEIHRSVSRTVEESISRSSIMETAEITSSVSYYITYIIQIIYEIQSMTTNTTQSTQTVDSIAVIRSFLSSLDMTQLSEEDLTELQRYAEVLVSVSESIAINSNAIIGIDLLLNVATSSSLELTESLESIISKEETVITIERTNSVIKIMAKTESEITTLMSKVSSSTSSQSDMASITEIELVISKLEIYITMISSKSYVITEEDISQSQLHFSSFSILVSRINSFSEIRGLTRLTTLVQRVITVMVNKKTSITKTFESKKSLETLNYMNSVVSDVKSFISQLRESSSSSSSSASLMIIEITMQMSLWSQGVQQVQRSAIDDVKGFFLTLQSLISSGGEVSGLSDLNATVTMVESNIEVKVKETILVDQRSESALITENAFNLIADSLDSMQQLLELTNSVTGESVSYEEVTNITAIIIKLSRKTSEITSIEIEELRLALEKLHQFIISFQSDTVVLGLKESVTEIQKIKKSFQKRIRTQTSGRVETLSTMLQTIINMMALLKSSMIDESIDASNADIVKSESFDDLFIFLTLQGQSLAISERDLQSLQLIIYDIQRVIAASNEYTVISGYSTTITNIITIGETVITFISEIIIEEIRLEEESEQFSLTESLSTNMMDIVSSLQFISEFQTASSGSSYAEQFNTYSATLQAISSDVTSFTNYTNVIKILETLRTIEDSNEKPEGIGLLLLKAESSLQQVEIYKEELNAKIVIANSLQRVAAVSQFSSNMVSDLESFFEGVNTTQLVGENNEEIGELIISLNSLSSNTDAITDEVLSEISFRFSRAKSLASDLLDDGQSIGNLLALRKAASGIVTSAENRRREQMDRELVNQEIIQVESSVELLNEIKKEISKKITKITSSKVTTTAASDSIEILNLTTTIKKITQDSFFAVSKEELQASLSALQNLQVNAGEELPGIFALQSLADQAVSAVQSDKQFLISTQQSRKSIDILSSSTGILTGIQSQLESMVTHFKGVESNSTSSSSLVFDDLFFVLRKIIMREEISFAFIEDLKMLLSDLQSFNLQLKIDLNIITQALEISRTASQITKTTLMEEKRISEERIQINLFERSVNSISNVQQILQSFESSSTANGEEIENGNMTLVFKLLRDISESDEIDENKITMLDKLTEQISIIDSTEFSGKIIIGLQEAVETVDKVQRSVTEELSFSRKSVARSVKKTFKSKVTTILDRMTNAFTQLASSTTMSTKLVENSVVSELLDFMSNITIEFITKEQVSSLTKLLSDLGNTTIEEGTSIAGLRQLKSMTIAKSESVKSGSKLLSAINKVAESKKVLTRTFKVISELNQELLDISSSSIVGDEVETEGIVSELLNVFESDLSTSNDENANRLEILLEKFRLVKSTIKVSSVTMQRLITLTSRAERNTQNSIEKFESKFTKVQQSETFTEMQTLLKTVSEKTQLIISSSGEETESSEENEKVNIFITLLKRFKSSALDINDEHLMFFKDNIQELNRILSRGTNVRNISKLKSLSKAVIESTSKEVEMLEREAKRDGEIILKTKQKRALSYTMSVLRKLLEKTNMLTSDTDDKSETRILEIEKMQSILKSVKQGSATDSDIEQLLGYTKSLESSLVSYTSRGRIIGLHEITETVNSMHGSLEATLIEDSFDSSYSESVFEQKQLKSLLSEAYEVLDSLMLTQGSGTSGSFSHSVFTNNIILQSIEKLEKKYSQQSITSFRRNLKTLKEVTANITVNTKIEGLKIVYQKTKSAIVSVESSISRSFAIEHASQEVENLKRGITLVSRVYFIIRTILRKTAQSSLLVPKRSVLEMDEIIQFFENVEVYTSKEIIILGEYLEILSILERDERTERVDRLDILTTHVVKRRTSMNKRLDGKSRVQRSQKQFLYTNAANERVQKTYRKIFSVKRNYFSEKVKEIAEVTRLSLFLRSVDMRTISAVQISKMNKEIESFSMAIANSQEDSIAYLSSVEEQLIEFSYMAEKHLQEKRSFDNEQKVAFALEKSRGALQAISSELSSLRLSATQQTITQYVENTIITGLFNFLLSYSSDFRLITDEFSQSLSTFDISSISITAGTGIKYLEEVFSLTDQYLTTEQQVTMGVTATESILEVKEFQDSLSVFNQAIDQFIYMVDNKETPKESGNLTGSNNDSIQTNPVLEDSPETDTTGGNSDEGSFEEEEDPSMMFMNIVTNINKISLSSSNFMGLTSSDTSVLIRRFMETDLKIVFSRFSRSYLQKSLSNSQRLSAKISFTVQSSESGVEVQKSFTRTEETRTILESIERNVMKISNSQKGSTDIVSIIYSIRKILLSFTSVHFITQEDITSLRSYSYQLSVASVASDDINLDLTELTSLISSTMEMVKSSSHSQSSFMTVSKIDSLSLSSSMGQTSSAKHVYSKEEIAVVKEISLVSQQYYILTQFDSLLSLARDSLIEVRNASGTGTDVNTVGSTEMPNNSNVTAVFEEETEDENEANDLFFQIAQLLKGSFSNVNNLQISSLSNLASLIRKTKSLINTTDEIDLAQVDETSSLITSAKTTFTRTITSISQYASKTQVFLNLQESSSLMDELSEVFRNSGSASQNDTDNNDINETALQHFDSITKYVIQFSLRSSSISEDSLRSFRKSLYFMKSYEGSLRFNGSNFEILKHFLIDSRKTVSQSVTVSASTGALVRTETQRDMFLITRAKSVVTDYLILLRNFSESLDGTEESTSPSRGRLMKIVSKSIIVSEQWTAGSIEKYQITMYENYLKELSELVIILRGTKFPTVMEILQEGLVTTEKSIMASSERITKEMKQDEDDAELDDKYEFYSQMSSFFENSLELSKDNDVTNANEITNGDHNTDQEEIKEIDYLLGMFDDASSNLLIIDIADIETNFTSLMFKLQKASSLQYFTNYKELLLVIRDAAVLMGTTRQVHIYERTSTIAATLSRAIPLSITKGIQVSESLSYVMEITDLHETLQTFRRQLHSVSKRSIRKLSRSVYNLQRIIESYGVNLAYLQSIDENLAYIQSFGMKYGRFAMTKYRYNRASMIYSKASEDIDNAERSIRSFIKSGESSSTVEEYERNDSVEEAFSFFINNAFDLVTLPNDLGRIVRRFNFSSLNITEGYHITHLKEVHHILKRLKVAKYSVATSSRYMGRASDALRNRQVVSDIVKKLHGFVDNSMRSNGNMGSSNSSIDSSTESNINTTNEVEDEAEGTPMTADDILTKVWNISSLMMNRLQLSESQSEELAFYRDIIMSISFDEGRNIKNLSRIINQLSHIASYLSLSVNAYESATQVTQLYSLLDQVLQINKIINKSLERISEGKGTSEMAALTDSLQILYEKFAMGYAFISEDDVNSCWKLVYKLSSLNATQGDSTVNTSSLLSRISEVETDITNVQGFLSAHSYHYERVMSDEKSLGNAREMVTSFELSSASQLSYLLFEMDNTLSRVMNTLYTFEEEDAGEDNSTLHDTFSDMYVILKAAESDLEGIQLSTLYKLSNLLLDLKTSVEKKILHNKTLVSDFTEFVQSRKMLFSLVGEELGDYGRTSTNVLIVQEAVGLVEYVTEETKRWIYGDTEICINCTTNGNETSSSTVQTSATTQASVTTVQPTTAPIGNPLSNNTKDINNKSFQDSFEEASDILMFWTFDSFSITGTSVSQFKSFVKILQTSCHVVKGIHMWDQMLISSNVTLLSALENTYLNQTLEKAELEEALLRYALASKSLNSYLEIIGRGDNNDIDSTSHGNSSNSTASEDGSTNDDTENDDENNDDNDNENDEPNMVIMDSMGHLISLSHRILEKWTINFDIRRSDILDLGFYSSEMLELSRAGGVFSNDIEDLRHSLKEANNFTVSATDSLNRYSAETSIARTNAMDYSFFLQMKQLVGFAIGFLKKLKAETSVSVASNSTSADGTSNVTSNASSSVSSNVSQSATNASMNATENYCKQILCAAEHLRDALRQLPSHGNESNTTSSTSPAAGEVTADGNSTVTTDEGNSIDSPISNGTNEEWDEYTAYFMDSYHMNEFAFDEVRVNVFALGRAMRMIGDASSVEVYAAVGLLEEAGSVIDDRLDEMETGSMMETSDVSVYFKTSDDVYET